MLYKRSSKPGAHWWVRFQVKGREVRQSSGTSDKALAEAFEQKVRDGIWNAENLGIEIHTWEEAKERWFKEKAHKRSLARDRQAFEAINLSGDITGDAPDGLSSVGARERAAYKGLVNSCVRWGWLDRAPKVEMPHAEKHDPRWITKEQFEKLCKELPQHAAQLARFAVATGMRQANTFRLRWDAIDFGSGSANGQKGRSDRRKVSVRLAAGDTKTRKAISVPLNSDAVAVLKRQSGHHPEYVFTDQRGHAPVGSIKTCWLKAVKRAGLEGFRFHDLRHTWAAWHTLKGTPPMILKELGGWASLAMVERYGHIGSMQHLAAWADNSSTGKNNGNPISKRRNVVDARKRGRERVPQVHQNDRSGRGKKGAS